MNFQEIKDALDGTAKRRARVKTTVGTSIGILLGAVAGILLAPKSGRETREDIRTAAEIGVENTAEVVQKAAEFAKKEAAVAKEKINSLKAHLKHPKEVNVDQDDVTEEDLPESSKSE